MTQQRVLITGATGSLGVAAVRLLESLPGIHVVRAVRDGKQSRPEDVTLDAADAESLRRAIAAAQPHAIVHLAALTGAACNADAAVTQAVNVDAVAALAAAAREHGTARFVFASSAAVYGDKHASPITETAPLIGGSPYAASKIAAERVLAEAVGDQLTAASLRIFNVWGPGMEQSLVNRLQHSTPDNPVQLRGGDEFVRDYVHVDDVALAIASALAAPLAGSHQAINVGTGRALSNAALVAALPGPVHAVFVDGEPSYSVANVDRARDILGLTARLHPGTN